MGAQLRPYDRMRRRRRDAEYPEIETPALISDEVMDDLPKIRSMVEIAERVLDQMSPF